MSVEAAAEKVQTLTGLLLDQARETAVAAAQRRDSIAADKIEKSSQSMAQVQAASFEFRKCDGDVRATLNQLIEALIEVYDAEVKARS